MKLLIKQVANIIAWQISYVFNLVWSGVSFGVY